MGIDVHGAVQLIRAGRGVGAALFADAAQRLSGAEVTWFGGSQAVAALQDRDLLIDGSSLNESAVGASIVHHKHLTKEFLLQHGIRTPHGTVVHSAEEAVAAAAQLPGPVVVKPVGGGLGRGVSVDLRGEDEVRDAYAEAVRRRPQAVLVEEYIDVEAEYRCMATENTCVAVVQRVLPFVLGDGASTVGELVAAKNLARKENPALHNLPIPREQVMDRTLARQGLNRDTVLDDGVRVTVRNVGGLSGGGEPHERSAEVSAELKELAHRSVAAIPGLRWAGIDVVTARGTGTPYVIEINVRAGYGAATFPLAGAPVDVAAAAWDQRLTISAPEVPRAEDPVPARTAPTRLGELLPGLDPAAPRRLGRVFFARAAEWGHHIVSRRGDVVELAFPEGGTSWFGANGAHPDELLSVRRIARIHRHSRALFHHHGLRRSRGRLVSGPAAIRRRLRVTGFPAAAVPLTASWGSEDVVLLHEPEDVEKLADRRHWYLQALPERRRLRILATRTQALTVLSLPEQDHGFSDAQLLRACTAAVDAVRAIPELPWAAVDLYFGRTASGSDHQGRAYVEGLSMNPMLTAEQRLLAGGFDELFHLMLTPGPEATS